MDENKKGKSYSPGGGAKAELIVSRGNKLGETKIPSIFCGPHKSTTLFDGALHPA